MCLISNFRIDKNQLNKRHLHYTTAFQQDTNITFNTNPCLNILFLFNNTVKHNYKYIIHQYNIGALKKAAEKFGCLSTSIFLKLLHSNLVENKCIF